MDAYQAYMKEIAEPMRQELTNYDFYELTTPEGVHNFMKDAKEDETTFVVINSVCGCAAGLARPAAVTVTNQNPVKPDRLATVFAGQERPATAAMREYIELRLQARHLLYLKVISLYHLPHVKISKIEILKTS